MQFLPQSFSTFEVGRKAEVLLVAELATLYLQSASGGLYASDRLALDLVVGAGAALHLTTQASTVVHDARGQGSTMCQSVTVKDNAFCAIISDPYVLFPGADLDIE